MPLTHAECQKRYRQKQLGKFGENMVKEKESYRRKEIRLSNIEVAREKDRERKRRSRQNKVESEAATVTSPPYKSASTLGKAVKRAQSALPKSPRKRAKVVKKLVMGVKEKIIAQKKSLDLHR